MSSTDETDSTDKTAPADTVEGLGYSDAVAELDTILGELEDDDIDIDVLATKVERAAVLIRFCRERIGAAKVQVERVVAELEDDQPDSVSAGETSTE